MAHSIYTLDPSYWRVSGGNIERLGVLQSSGATNAYIFNPTTLNSAGFNKNSVLTDAQIAPYLVQLTGSDLSIPNASDFLLSNWISLGWGSNAATVLSAYDTFAQANILTSASNAIVNAGQYPVTTALVSGSVGGSTYFVPVLLTARQGALLTAPTFLITGIIAGALTGGLPKAVEFYVGQDIANLSIYGLAVGANANPDPSTASFTFPATSATKGTYLWVSSETTTFTSFFGAGNIQQQVTWAGLSANGNDRIVLFQSGTVIDRFGEQSTDGTGRPWENTAGWAYRLNSDTPTPNFRNDSWMAMKSVFNTSITTNASAPNPMPIGTWKP